MSTPLLLAIDKSSPVPIYHQLAQALENAIRSGTLAPGTKLDNEAVLAARLHIARTTVRKALDPLADAGLVVRRRRIGTYVTATAHPPNPLWQTGDGKQMTDVEAG